MGQSILNATAAFDYCIITPALMNPQIPFIDFQHSVLDFGFWVHRQGRTVVQDFKPHLFRHGDFQIHNGMSEVLTNKRWLQWTGERIALYPANENTVHTLTIAITRAAVRIVRLPGKVRQAAVSSFSAMLFSKPSHSQPCSSQKEK